MTDRPTAAELQEWREALNITVVSTADLFDFREFARTAMPRLLDYVQELQEMEPVSDAFYKLTVAQRDEAWLEQESLKAQITRLEAERDEAKGEVERLQKVLDAIRYRATEDGMIWVMADEALPEEKRMATIRATIRKNLKSK